MRFIHWGLT